MSVHAISRASSLLARILLMNQAVVVCAVTKDTRLCRDIYDIPSKLGQPSPDVRNVLTCVTLHHFHTSHNTYIFDSLEAAPPVTLATRSWDSSFFRSSSCLSSSSFFLPRRSLALILAWPPSKEK